MTVHGGLLRLETPGNGHIVDITAGVQRVVGTAGIDRGVVTVFAIINTWKDFLWPNLVLPGGSDPASVQPLSVRLPAIQGTTEVGPYLASLAIATLIPIIMFLIFQ